MDKAKGLPGDRESYDKDCVTKRRNGAGYCTGRGLGEACNITSGAYCDVGMYCSATSVCAKVKYEGEACTALIECAPYLLCNLGMPSSVCTLPYSLKPSTYGQFTAIPNLCSTGWLNSSTYMCKDTAEYASGTQMLNAILNPTDSLCTYADGTVLDGECMYYSYTPLATVFCQPYNASYAAALADVYAYAQQKPLCGQGTLNMFCDMAIERIDPCMVRKALMGMTYAQLIRERYYPGCWEKTYTLTVEIFTCGAGRTTVSLLATLLILLFLI